MRVLAVVCSLLMLSTIPVAAQEPEMAPPEDVARAFVLSLYTGDVAARDTLAPLWAGQTAPEEAHTTLDSIEARPLTRGEAQDADPLSDKDYAEVTATFSLADRHGTATYLIGLAPRPDGELVYGQSGRATNLMVYLQSGAMQWAP